MKYTLAMLCLCLTSVLHAQYIATESEPNGTTGTANALTLTNGSARVRGSVCPNADFDYYSFSGAAGDRVFAAVMTSASSNSSTDSELRIYDTDGATVLEFDNDDGSFGGLSSSIAGLTLTNTGTHFIEVKHFSATNQLRPYDLYFRLVTAATVFATETEPNNIIGNATAIGPDLVAAGTVDPAADVDFFSLTLNAGDTVFVSLDLDPERDATTFNGRLGFGVFASQLLLANDTSATSPNSEAFFMTVRTAGTYHLTVDDSAAGGAATSTYRLAIAVFPNVTAATPTTYTNSTPLAIPAATSVVNSTINIPDNRRIGRVSVAIDITHATMADMDVYLTSPSGTNVVLFTDVGAGTGMNCVFDAYAGLTAGTFAILQGMHLQPELQGRLEWFNGQTSLGTWTLNIAVDAAGAGGTLNSWSLIVEEEPINPLTAAPYTVQTFLNADFEATDNGFTHSGTLDEWERGTPSFAPLTSAFSGTNCWCTDLDNTYEASSDQSLFSPAVDLSTAIAPIRVRWAMKHHMEAATFDTLSVRVQEVGNPANFVELYQWLGATQNQTLGNPGVAIAQTLGWGQFFGDISAMAGLNVEFVVRVTSDTTVNLAGVAIDDVIIEGAVNTAPTYTAPGGNVLRGQESGSNGSAIGTVGDAETPVTSLVVNITSAAPTGVTFGTPTVGAGGVVTLPITMTTMAVIGTYTINLTVTDGDAAVTSGQFTLEVVAGTVGGAGGGGGGGDGGDDEGCSTGAIFGLQWLALLAALGGAFWLRRRRARA